MSDLLIKGMEMPKNCHECPFLYVTSICDGFKDCPIVTVPPHGRLIDADELRAEFPKPTDWMDIAQALVHRTAVWDAIDCAETIIEAEDGA